MEIELLILHADIKCTIVDTSGGPLATTGQLNLHHLLAKSKVSTVSLFATGATIASKLIKGLILACRQ